MNKLRFLVSGKGLTCDVVGVVNDALHSVEDSLAVDQVVDEPLHARLPRVATVAARILLDRIGVGIGIGNLLAVGVAEPHGDEPHLLGDALALSRVPFPVPSPLP